MFFEGPRRLHRGTTASRPGMAGGWRVPEKPAGRTGHGANRRDLVLPALRRLDWRPKKVRPGPTVFCSHPRQRWA